MAKRGDKIYVLEANPRSSRTIPFVSKAVGLPLAKIAARVIMGETLEEQGYSTCDEPKVKHVSVKEVLLPFDKLPGADPLLGPEMKSTGEVMGVDSDYGRAFFKAQLSADNLLPLTGKVFVSVKDEDRDELLDVAQNLVSAGIELLGTKGTADFLSEHGIEMGIVKKVHDGSPNVIDMMRRYEVDLVINTPEDKLSREDGSRIRRAAVDFKVPYITTIQAAIAASNAIVSMKQGEGEVKSINEYHREMA
jgi:carbamoyl-phosphate synthase large subunit